MKDQSSMFMAEVSFNITAQNCRIAVKNLKFWRVFSKKKKKGRHGKLHFTFFNLKKLVGLFILKEVKSSPDSKVTKRLTFDDLFPPLRHSQ